MTLPVVVTVPSTAALGDADVVIIRIESAGDAATMNVATLPMLVTEQATSLNRDTSTRQYLPLLH
ncbi:MAG: hypothetical protein R2856_13675 [Caldilineaceae bacterium]